jgi:hypothetical protein
MTPERLARMFRNKEKVNVKNIGRIFEYANVPFIIQFTNCLSEEFFVQAYAHSTLSQISKFVYHYACYSPICKSAYEKYAKQALHTKLQDSSMIDIQKFISRVGKTRYIGPNLGKAAVHALRKIDINKSAARGPIQKADVEKLIYTISLTEDPDFIVRQFEGLDLV